MVHGHAEHACKKALGLPACSSCGKDNHKQEDCKHKTKICNVCKKVGHLAMMCPTAASDNKKQATSTSTAQPEDDTTKEWYCTTCARYHPLHVKFCLGCKKKRDVEEPEEAKTAKPQAGRVSAWANVKPADGDTVTAPEDQETANEKKELEDTILMLKKMPGKADMVKELEEDLKNLQKKKPVHTVEKDCVSVAQAVRDATEKAARMKAQAERKLEKVVTLRSDLDKTHVANAKKLKEEYEKRLEMAQKAYEKEKLKVDEEVVQVKKNLEDETKEGVALVTEAKAAFVNVAAANTRSSQKPEDGQQCAAQGAAPGAVLVPTSPGYILHANDVSSVEMQQFLSIHPNLVGITPDMVAAVTGAQMQYLQMKSTVVVAGPAGVEPPTGGAAEERQQEVDGPGAEEEQDPMTSDDEEEEMIAANKKEGEVVRKPRIPRSAKAARKAKVGKGVIAAAASNPTVKSTIGK